MTRFTGKQIKKARRMTAAEYDAANAERFWRLVDMGAECWIWRGAKRSNGYGVVGWQCKHRPAHRVAYRLTHGSEPNGLEVIHRCDNPSCVRPDHLRAGTHADNMMDVSRHGYHAMSLRSACPQGHPYAGRNVMLSRSGRRSCRTCHTMRRIIRRERQRQNGQRVT